MSRGRAGEQGPYQTPKMFYSPNLVRRGLILMPFLFLPPLLLTLVSTCLVKPKLLIYFRLTPQHLSLYLFLILNRDRNCDVRIEEWGVRNSKQRVQLKARWSSNGVSSGRIWIKRGGFRIMELFGVSWHFLRSSFIPGVLTVFEELFHSGLLTVFEELFHSGWIHEICSEEINHLFLYWLFIFE